MLDYYLFARNDECAHARDPFEVVVCAYPDGRWRVQRRDQPTEAYWAWSARKRVQPAPVTYRHDRWYSSFDAVVPLLTAMCSNNRYTLYTADDTHTVYMGRRGVPYSQRPFDQWVKTTGPLHSETREQLRTSNALTRAQRRAILGDWW